MVTSINRDLQQFKNFRYPVTVRLIPKGGAEADEVDLSPGLSRMRIIKDYDHNVFPYMSIELQLSAEDVRKVQQVWQTAKLYVTIDKRTVAVTSNAQANQQEVDTNSPFIKDVEFQIMTLDGSPTATPTASAQISDMARNAPRTMITLEVAPTVALGMNKKLNNGAYHDATVTDVVAHTVHSNVPASKYPMYMAPSDNATKYESLVLPPLSLSQAVRYVDEVHGLYHGLLHVFLDFDKGHILSSAKTIGMPQGQPARVVIEVGNLASATPEQSSGSGYDPKAFTFRLRTGQRIGVDLRGPANKENVGESVKLVGSTLKERTGSDCQMLTPDGQTLSTTPKERVVYSGYDNPLTPGRMAVVARERFAPSMVSFHDADLAAFDPKLPWTLQSGDEAQQELEGNWRLAGSEFILRRSPGSQGSCSCDVMIRIVPASNGGPPVTK